MEVERRRLQAAGQSELANRVEWVARTKGDGLGYDILSFDNAGNEIWIEVKTTNGRKETPYCITKRELHISAQHSENYRVYRVFDFGKLPRIYVLTPPLEMVLELEPISWRAWP